MKMNDGGLVERPLSARSQTVMSSARDVAIRLRHEYIGTEHLLLGIASNEGLKSCGVVYDQVVSIVKTIVGIGPVSASPDDRGVTPRAKRVMSIAQEEASLRDDLAVEPEHLLIGIARESGGVAAQVLRDLRIAPELIHNQALERLDQNRGGLGAPV